MPLAKPLFPHVFYTHPRYILKDLRRIVLMAAELLPEKLWGTSETFYPYLESKAQER